VFLTDRIVKWPCAGCFLTFDPLLGNSLVLGTRMAEYLGLILVSPILSSAENTLHYSIMIFVSICCRAGDNVKDTSNRVNIRVLSTNFPVKNLSQFVLR
jgi:hypothetical protein